MKSLYELKSELRKISSMFNSDFIPLTVDGKEIESVELHDDRLSGGGYHIEIKTMENKEKAMEAKTDNYVTTIKIEWEE